MDNTLSLIGANLILGFILGIKHAFDSDHVVTVSTIASQTKSIKHASFLGAFWGLGHTLVLMIVGILLLLFKLKLPEDILIYFEIPVGLILIFLFLCLP